MLKAIIFDWGGVLIDNPATDLIDYCARQLKVSSSDLKTNLEIHLRPFQLGEISEKTFWSRICKPLQVKPPTNSLWRQAADQVFKENEEIFSLLESLKANGYKTAILSDTELPMVDYFFNHNYHHYFDVYTFSCLEHLVKPDPTIYLKTLNKLQVSPSEAIFIDDKPKNIRGAQKVGLSSIVFHDFKQLVQDLRIYLPTNDKFKTSSTLSTG